MSEQGLATATMRTLRLTLTVPGRSPFKLSLLLVTIAMGVVAMIFALSISSTMSRAITERLERDGLVVTIFDYSDPGQPWYRLNQQAMDTLMSEVTGATAASLVSDVPEEYAVAGTIYQVRTAVAASESYLRVMGLEVIAGVNVVDAPNQAAISATLAEVLFGSAAAALGQTLQTAPPRIAIGGEVSAAEVDRIRRSRMSSYTVRGVFADPDELRRRVYDIADLVVSLRSDSSIHSIVLRVSGSRLATVESYVRAALARQYGYDAAIAVRPRGASFAALESDPRSTVQTLSLILNLLAALTLAVGAVGLMSLTMIEVLGRTRQIALSRAFGATKGTILREFLARSLITVGVASALGAALSLFLSVPLTEAVMPVLQDAVEIDLTGPVITPAAVAAGVAAALGVGALLGPLPVFSALAAPIAEGIRDL